MRILSIFILSLSLIIALPAYSGWQLDSKNSSVTFVSIKKGTVAENHRFKQFSGGVTDKGIANITIDLNSVDTNISVRDERMAKFLFETNLFEYTRFTAQLDQKDFNTIAVGSTRKMSIKGNLDLHGQQQELLLNVMVAKLSEQQLVVTTLQPVIIKAEDFSLVKGINKLKSLAQLPSIAYSVPVSFVLTFRQ
jgi:polyisoprenoid-binding protein YceI